MRKNLLSFFAVAVLMLIAAVGYAQTTFTKITSASELEAGANYLIVAHYDDLGVLAMGKQNNNNRPNNNQKQQNNNNQGNRNRHFHHHRPNGNRPNNNQGNKK